MSAFLNKTLTTAKQDELAYIFGDKGIDLHIYIYIFM
jgi:hypothetical protein